MLPIQRRIMRLVGVGCPLFWADVLAGHAGGGFHHIMMWLPVVFLPIAGAVVWIVSARDQGRRVLALLNYCFIGIGFLGMTLHLAKFIERLQGAVPMEIILRLMRNPPLLAPLGIAGLGVLGMVVLDERVKGHK